MTAREKEIYNRARARAACGWSQEFLIMKYEGEDLKTAVRGHLMGTMDRIRLAAEREEKSRARPVYSRVRP